MIYTKEISGFTYVRVSIIVWTTNGPSRIKNIDHAAGQCLKKIVLDNVEKKVPLVIDMRGIVAFTDGSMNDLIKEICNQSVEAHFVGSIPIHPGLQGLYRETKGISTAKMAIQEDKFVIHSDGLQLRSSSTEISHSIREYLDSEIKEMVKNTFVPNPGHQLRALSSTPILATGQYDASIIVSNPEKFVWVCTRMADVVEDLIKSKRIRNAQLLSVSLRASPFASAISLLIDVEMRTIDHLGPIQKVWDYGAFTRFGSREVNYIFIGDFIVGGTELKMAHLFAKYSSSTVENAVVLGTVLDSERYEGYSIHSITPLKGLNEHCEYNLFEK